MANPGSQRTDTDQSTPSDRQVRIPQQRVRERQEMPRNESQGMALVFAVVLFLVLVGALAIH